MKRFLVAVVLLLGASLTASRAEAHVDSCLSLFRWQGSPDSTMLNPDSLMVDTCLSDSCQYDPAMDPCSWYAKKRFLVTFQYYIFSDSVGPAWDTVRHQWQEIDSTMPGIRNRMGIIEKRFGRFSLYYHFNGGIQFDTANRFAKAWDFYFEEYVNVDSALAYLRALPDIDSNRAGFYPGLRFILSGGSRVSNLLNHAERVVAWPQPCSNEIVLQGAGRIEIPEIMDLLGRHLALPTRFESDSALHIDLTSVPSGILLLKLPQQVIRITVRK